MNVFKVFMLGGSLLWAGLGMAEEGENNSAQQEVAASPFQVIGASTIDDESYQLAAGDSENIQCYRKPQHGSLLKKLVCRKIDTENADETVRAH